MGGARECEGATHLNDSNTTHCRSPVCGVGPGPGASIRAQGPEEIGDRPLPAPPTFPESTQKSRGYNQASFTSSHLSGVKPKVPEVESDPVQLFPPQWCQTESPESGFKLCPASPTIMMSNQKSMERIQTRSSSSHLHGVKPESPGVD